MKIFYLPVSLAMISLVIACSSPQSADKEQAKDSTDYYSAADFSKVEKIDAHVHVQTKDSTFLKKAVSDNFKLVTINYDDVNEPPPMEAQQEDALFLKKSYPDALEYATTVSIRKFNDPGWLSQTISYIDNSVAHGAKAVKIYKVIGMSLRDKQGKLVMVDDPRLDTLFNYLAVHKIPVVGHLGEPRNCWLPLDSMTVRGDSSYFASQPEYHMYKHPDMPSYEQQIAARDNMLAKHPDLTFIGAHLGSLEWNVDSLAARLGRFPNMAVDMAARIVHFQVQTKSNWQKVHDFLVKYSDRLLYATDLVVDDHANAEDAARHADETWKEDWKFFTTDEQMASDQFDGTFKGLKLPKAAIDNIYHNNARKWLGVFK